MRIDRHMGARTLFCGLACLLLQTEARADIVSRSRGFALTNDATVQLGTFISVLPPFLTLSLLQNSNVSGPELAYLSIPKFDPMWGTLDAVEVHFTTYTASSTLTVNQSNLLTLGVISSATVNQSLSLTDSLPNVDLSDMVSLSRNKAALISLHLGQNTTTVTTDAPMLDFTTAYTDGASLSDFTGVGNFDLTVNSGLFVQLASVVGVAVLGPPTLGGQTFTAGAFTVDYYYTPDPECQTPGPDVTDPFFSAFGGGSGESVPEPAAGFLTAAGLALCLGRRSRSRY